MTETSLAAHASALVKQNPARVFHFEFDGGRLWLKQVERPTGRTRIFKPGPHRKFRKELAAHEALLESGAPVAKILLKTDRYVVLEDVGPNLEQLWRREREDAEERLKATIAAAQALATMHAKNLVHGRPVARDVCWDGSKSVF